MKTPANPAKDIEKIKDAFDNIAINYIMFEKANMPDCIKGLKDPICEAGTDFIISLQESIRRLAIKEEDENILKQTVIIAEELNQRTKFKKDDLKTLINLVDHLAKICDEHTVKALDSTRKYATELIEHLEKSGY